VLEVRLTARQGQATSIRSPRRSKNFLLFDYEVIRGTASDGQTSGGNLYPAPTLHVFPGERLIVHLENGLTGLTIRDYFSPQYTPNGQSVPIYPEQMTSSPINLHTHGAHISPKGNADNVMLQISLQGCPTPTPMTSPGTCAGDVLVSPASSMGSLRACLCGSRGLLAIGRTDGNLPLVTHSHPEDGASVYFVFDRAGGLAHSIIRLGQWVNSITPQRPASWRTAPTAHRLRRSTSTNSKPGTKYVTVWYAGPLSIRNMRALSSSSQQSAALTSVDGNSNVPADPSLARTPNGMANSPSTASFNPVIKKQGRPDRDLGARECERHRLHERPSSRKQRLDGIRRSPIVGQDGNPYTTVRHPPTTTAPGLLIPPGEPVRDRGDDKPAEGELVLEMPERGGCQKRSAPPACSTPAMERRIPRRLEASACCLPDRQLYADGSSSFRPRCC